MCRLDKERGIALCRRHSDSLAFTGDANEFKGQPAIARFRVGPRAAADDDRSLQIDDAGPKLPHRISARHICKDSGFQPAPPDSAKRRHYIYIVWRLVDLPVDSASAIHLVLGCRLEDRAKRRMDNGGNDYWNPSIRLLLRLPGDTSGSGMATRFVVYTAVYRGLAV